MYQQGTETVSLCDSTVPFVRPDDSLGFVFIFGVPFRLLSTSENSFANTVSEGAFHHSDAIGALFGDPVP